MSDVIDEESLMVRYLAGNPRAFDALCMEA
jgi:hypothetical protein